VGNLGAWGAPQNPPPAEHEIAEYMEIGVGMEYEAQVPLSTLNDFGLFDQDNERIGFAIIVENASSAYEEWPSGAEDQPSGNSDSWGQLEIPEFKDILIPIFSMILIAAVWRRKKRK
jgi:hypothetical protein